MSAKVNRQMDLTPWTGIACEFSDGVPGTTLLQVSRMMFSKNVLVVDIKYFFLLDIFHSVTTARSVSTCIGISQGRVYSPRLRI